MKKVLAWLCVIIGIVLLVSSSSASIILRIWKWNTAHLQTNAWYGKYSSKWGDLARMSELDSIAQFEEAKSYTSVKPEDNGNKNLALYILGDSHTEDIPASAYVNTATYCQGRSLAYTLDPGKKNILILETTERFVLAIYKDTEVFDALKRKGTTPPVNIYVKDVAKNYSRVINKNLNYLLFDYNMPISVQRAKAEMTYRLFARGSGDVAVSKNGRYLFFRPTISPFATTSSYFPVDDNTISNVVANLNTIYQHYKNEGFSEVYLTVIPNPATILQPQGYNNLIPRITNDPALKMPCIDIYHTFKNAPNPSALYRAGDTHWNGYGTSIWLDAVNAELRKQSASGK